MLISILGPSGAGKESIAQYLTTQHGFSLLCIAPQTVSQDAVVLKRLDLNARRHRSDYAAKCSKMFTEARHMLDYTTNHWQEMYVTLDLVEARDIDAFAKRPFYLQVTVDAPLYVRYRRWLAKYTTEELTLESFVQEDDAVAFGFKHDPSQTGTVAGGAPAIGSDGIVDDAVVISDSGNASSLSQLRKYSQLSINNTFSTLLALYAHLDSLHLTSGHRLRPGWDAYFLSLCNLASLRSNCMKRRVGAVLVSSNRILATGYNGTPSGLTNCNQGGCPRCNNTLNGTEASSCGQNLEECLCLHAEENALLEAGRAKIAAPTEIGTGGGATLYCNTCPCLRCAVKIIQCGIKKVVYQLEYSMDTRTKHIFAQSGVEIRQFHLE